MKSQFPKFKAGIYRHYKGPLYLVIGLAHDANDEARTAVVYVSLEIDQAKAGPRLAVRDYQDFYAWTNPKTGEIVSPKSPGAKKRFTYVGQTLQEASQ